MPAKKTFREKLADPKDFPRIEPLPPGMQKQWGKGTIVIPRPDEVDAIMRRVPEGKLITINGIRELVAARHGATSGCPIVVGIFARIAAGAAGEDLVDGKQRVTPYWRTLLGDGRINPKYPGGIEGQAELLRSEGHTVTVRGKTARVQDLEAKLVRLAP
ncbi:MAG TPA: hypothetical protein VGC54_05385 [Planctomycetota bacterium]